MDGSTDFKSLQDRVQGALVTSSRAANAVAQEDLSFLRTVDPAVGTKLEETTARLVKLSEELLKSAASFVGQSAPSIEDADDIDISWRGVVDVVDTLLEKADTCLDEYTGLIKRKEAPTPDQGGPNKKQKQHGKLDWSMRRANIIKPQNAFERKADNFDTSAWKPILSSKPHATLPLDQSLTTFVDSDDNKQYTHPYETEISNLSYPKRLYEKAEPIPYLPFESTTATWVDTYEGVLEMLEELKKAKEIAVDLEHHEFRTYVGLTSLMQISTREKDWVIDTLRPWRHKLEVLNEVFADPNIIKVLHGAFMDIIWLQRDLGLYMVNMFDTYYACDALGYPGRGLAFLLKKFCDFDADKKYQTADWRLRPLPDEMFYYARSDTHYLLYIYDNVRNELVEKSDPAAPEKNWIEWVLQKSKEVTLQRYETPLCDEETGRGSRGWFNTLVKSPSAFNAEQFAVYKAVFKWRDNLARREDESPYFIMSNAAVADIARVLPEDPRALWSLVHGSQTVKARLDELFDVVQKAREKGKTGPTMMEYFKPMNSVAAVAKKVFGEQEKSKVAQAPVPELESLKAERSQLWGDMPISSRWEGENSKRAEEGQIALPWTTYVQGMVAGDAMEVDAADEASAEVDMIPLQDPEPEPVPDEDFNLKQGKKSKRGKKRKTEEMEEGELDEEDDAEESKQTTDAEADTSGTAALIAAEEELAAKKKQRKLERKARKAAKNGLAPVNGSAATTPGSGTPAAGEEEEEPFDYSKAASVLHAGQGGAANGGDGSGGRQRRGKKQKVFDPYAAKTQDNSLKGARKMNYEKSGKSATFKK